MVTRIAHLSDIHIERCDPGVADFLARALRNENVDILAVSGDLVDNPWRLKRGKMWLADICKQCAIDPATGLLIVPGNHDYRIYGNFGFKPITGPLFRRQFPGWNRVVFLPDRGITFFKIDSNPLVLGFARGHIWGRQFRQISNDLSHAEVDREAIERSTKIAIIHHHPLPVPYEGGDTFLMLDNAQEFIQFLAEHRIDMVLHGHKHRAPHSLLSLGTCGGGNRVIEFVGAGTAVARADRESRGYNFNLITIEDSGLRYVRQFFAQPGEPFHEKRGEHFCAAAFDSAWRRAFAVGHRYRQVHWDLEIDEDGDVLNECAYVGVSATTGKPLETIPLGHHVGSGHISPVSLVKRRTTEGVTLITAGQGPRDMEFAVGFEQSPSNECPADFCLRKYDLNSFCMDTGEFRRKLPTRKDATDYAEKLIREPVDQFTFEVRFPRALRLPYPPHLEVVAGDTGQRHEWLTEVLRPCFHFSEVMNTAFLSVSKPVPNFGYRIVWRYPDSVMSSAPVNVAGKLKARRFADCLLHMSDVVTGGTPDAEAQALSKALTETLVAFTTEIEARIGQLLGAQPPGEHLNTGELDVSLMICDDREETKPPQLRTVGGTGNPTGAFILEVGDGIAGRAFKKGSTRIYDRSAAERDPKNQAYVIIPGRSHHEFLYSLPLLDPAIPQLIFGTLNLGTFLSGQAELLRLLHTPEGVLWMEGVVRSQVLPRLFAITGVSSKIPQAA